MPTIDADVVARDVVAAGTPALAAILERFGAGVLGADGALDRGSWGRSCSRTKPRAYAWSRSFIRPSRPPSTRGSTRWVAQHRRRRHSVALRSGPGEDFDVVITTACSADEQRHRRLMTRDTLNELQARQRINAQLSTEEKVRRADYAIWTDGTHENTKRQVVETLEQWRAGRPTSTRSCAAWQCSSSAS